MRLMRFLLAVMLLSQPLIAAAPSAHDLLPASTKGFASVPDLEGARLRWNETQIGRLGNDPLMHEFITAFRTQIRQRLDETGEQLGLTWDDVAEVYGGEIALAHIEPGNEEGAHAVVLVIDTSGHHEQADALIEKIAHTLATRKATEAAQLQGTTSLRVFQLPPKPGARQGRQVVLFHEADRLVLSDHVEVAAEMADRLSQFRTTETPSDDALVNHPPYQRIVDRCAQSRPRDTEDMRWYVEPFGYTRVLRASHSGPRRRGTDRLKILTEQGFDAIQGIGGLVFFVAEGHDLEHRTFIYAPRDPNAVPGERFRLAARALKFPNAAHLSTPRTWVPADVSAHGTFEWDVKYAFDQIGTLIDAFATSEGFFEGLLDSFANDPDGPQLDIRNAIVHRLANRLTVLVDHSEPIDTHSEQILVAMEVGPDNERQVREAVDKALATDPGARAVKNGDHVIWEFFEEEEDDYKGEITLDGVDPFPLEEERPEEEEESADDSMLSHLAITVANNHLYISSHVSMIEKVLAQRGAENDQGLTSDGRFQRVSTALQQLGATEDSLRLFTRQERTFRQTYEMLRCR